MTDNLNLIELVSTGNLNQLKERLAHGAEVDEIDAYGNTALWRAVYDYSGDGAFIQLLLESGADANHKNKTNKSPKELAYTIATNDVKKYFPE